MANMSYRRFENTLGDLQDCYEALSDAGSIADLEKDVNQYERPNIRKLVQLCMDIAADFGDEMEED